MIACVNEVDAKHVAVKFLEQYHNNVLPKEIVMNENSYLITLVTGVLEKKTVQVKVDTTTGLIVGVNYPVDFAKIVDNILEINNQIRYVLVVNSKGYNIHSKMSQNKTCLIKSEDQLTNLSSDLHILKQLLKVFDESLGKTTFIHFQREKIHILIFYVGDLIVCASCERSLSEQQIIDISNKIRLLLEKKLNPQ